VPYHWTIFLPPFGLKNDPAKSVRLLEAFLIPSSAIFNTAFSAGNCGLIIDAATGDR